MMSLSDEVTWRRESDLRSCKVENSSSRVLLAKRQSTRRGCEQHPEEEMHQKTNLRAIHTPKIAKQLSRLGVDSAKRHAFGLGPRMELLVNFFEPRMFDVGVDLRCLDAGVTEHFLDLA